METAQEYVNWMNIELKPGVPTRYDGVLTHATMWVDPGDMLSERPVTEGTDYTIPFR